MLNKLPNERAGSNQNPRILFNFILHFVSYCKSGLEDKLYEESGSWVDTDNPKAAC